MRLSAKSITSGLLLAFVAVSVAYLVVTEVNGREVAEVASPEQPQQIASSADAAAQDNPTDAGEPEQESPVAVEPEQGVIAYYFHGSKRCATCRTIEAYTDESLKAAFPDELEAGTLEWRPVNVEEPGNGHFIQDYQLTTRSVVLVDTREEGHARWKNLTRVWELVRDKPAFLSYIQEETRGFLKE